MDEDDNGKVRLERVKEVDSYYLPEIIAVLNILNTDNTNSTFIRYIFYFYPKMNQLCLLLGLYAVKVFEMCFV